MDIKLPLKDTDLARRLKVSPQAVCKWSRVPSDRVIEVAEACEWQVTPHQIRPDIYPHPDDGLPEHLRGQAKDAA